MTKPLWERNILLVEFDSTLRRLIRESLTELGAVVETTEDARRIANLTTKHVYDLIILDQKVGNIDSKIIAKSIMGKRDYADSHLIVLATAVEFEDLEQRRDYGITTYIVKPFPMDKLLNTVKKLLSPT